MEKTNLETISLINDLALTESDANGILGGLDEQDPDEPDTPQGSPLPNPKVKLRPGYGCGGVLMNHNETTMEDNSSELNDLAVNTDAEIVGGPLKRIRIGGMSFGEEGAE